MSRIRKAARDEECTLRLPGVCNGRTDTTVLAHSNRSSDGKGMGLKSRDDRGAFACYNCHAVLDGQAKRPPWLSYFEVQAAFDAGVRRTRTILESRGLLRERGIDHGG